MVRSSAKSHQEDDEFDDEEFAFSTPEISSNKVRMEEGKSNNDQKVNALRSKHSETEQRRRSKINERFQVLRDIIPENDQKRDKASFLLEVIQYIQFLQEKIQMYEETYQGWSQEPSKLIPWRKSSGLVENFVDRPLLMRNGSGHEDNITVSPSLLSSSQAAMDSELNAARLCTPTDHLRRLGNEEDSSNLLVQPNLFDVVSMQPSQGSFPDPEHLATHSPSGYSPGKPSTSECAVPSYKTSQREQLQPESGEATISNVSSQGLLNNLKHALQSSGVDLCQVNMSVQLDMGKRTNGATATTLISEDYCNIQQKGCSRRSTEK